VRRSRILFCLLSLGAACSDPAVKPAGSASFDGVTWIAPDKTGRLVVGWKQADAATQYRVYISLHQGRPLKNAPVATTTDTTLVITPTSFGERHYVTVRAVDAAGVEDGNTVEKSAIAAPDTTPPQFAGARTAVPFANAGATLSWDPATDEASPQEAIAYDIFAGRTPQTLAQVGHTKPGETSISVEALGTPAEPFVFAVRARDVADNVSTDMKAISGPLGPDVMAPGFGGCATITDVGSKSLTIGWQPANDDHTKPDEMQYEIYAAGTSGAQDFAAPPLAKVKGATSVDLRGLEPAKPYFFVCRVRDTAGNLDANTNEATATTSSDVTAPAFDGVQTATVDGIKRTVVLSWNPATDDTTATANIVYDVFESKVENQHDFDAPPRATSAPGATSVKIENLEPRTRLYWVVRARDQARNRDLNFKELFGDTKTSFEVNVLPILVHDCAVVGCHVTGIQPAGLNLAPAFAYDQLVGVTARLGNPKKRVEPGFPEDSFLWDKLNGTLVAGQGAPMPAPQTGNTLTPSEKQLIESWILEGAERN
jgi:hypothetical protein